MLTREETNNILALAKVYSLPTKAIEALLEGRAGALSTAQDVKTEAQQCAQSHGLNEIQTFDCGR